MQQEVRGNLFKFIFLWIFYECIWLEDGHQDTECLQ